MSNYSFTEGTFGDYQTIILSNDKTGAKIEVALRGATALKYLIPFNGAMLDILDGFATPQEMNESKGARCWIMAPFANRIPDGKYIFNGQELMLDPVPPRNQVIHGFLSNIDYDLYKVDKTENSIEATLVNRKIRKGVIKGYPFSLDVYVKFKLEEDKLSVNITAENIGDEPAPFGTGWHSYLKTGNGGIENLVLTADAEKTIVVNSNLIPFEGEKAYGNIGNFPALDFRGGRLPENRILKDKILDNAFSELKKDKDGYSRTSIHDLSTGLTLSIFQRGGIVLVFTGDSLPGRKRNSVAIEPMQFITNAFNRPEYKDEITVQPGKNSVFEFGIEISR